MQRAISTIKVINISLLAIIAINTSALAQDCSGFDVTSAGDLDRAFKCIESLSVSLTQTRSELAVEQQKTAELSRKLLGGGEIIPQPVGNGRSATCPSGSYMVSILWQIDSGGPHGIVSNVQPVCKSLK